MKLRRGFARCKVVSKRRGEEGEGRAEQVQSCEYISTNSAGQVIKIRVSVGSPFAISLSVPVRTSVNEAERVAGT
jgi:hypothetical protein